LLGLERNSRREPATPDLGPWLEAEGDQIVDLDDQLAEMTALRDEGKIGAGDVELTADALARLDAVYAPATDPLANRYGVEAFLDER
jgi:hypothetical protein